MKFNKLFTTILLAGALLPAEAEIKMPAFFSDNMLIQQETNARIWGTADPKSKILVAPSWTAETYSTTTDKTGEWSVAIPTPKTDSKPQTITVTENGKNPVTISNVLLGDLWLCSGQSNMEMTMKGFKSQPVYGGNLDAVKSANPDLRVFTVKRKSSTVPVDTVTGKWSEANAKSIRDFSATAYYFGRLLQETLDVPIGLIVTAWGGSSVEAWMSKDMLKAFPDLYAKIPAVDGKIPSKNRTANVLYNGMLNPLIGLPMKGVIWYQGEENANRAESYADLFSTMIKGWRSDWGIGDFPFYYCQIAPYDYSRITAVGDPLYNSAYLREQQAKVEDMVPNTGMAVTLDIGLEKGIHPPHKKEVGERLAFLALAKTYGVEGVGCESPRFASMEIKGDTVQLSFERSKEWIVCYPDFESKNFQLAGEDQVFHPAVGKIQGKHVIVTSPEVKNPVAVRYGFTNWVQGDLFSTDMLPVGSFRSDDWPDPKPVKE